MRKLFSMDNPLMKALSTAADLLLLNLLTLICCLPLVTLGAAVTAMYEVTIRSVCGDECYIVKPYFRAFAANLKRGLLLSLILLAAAGALYFDYLAALTYIPPMRVGILAISVILFAISLYVFALQAHYENSLGGTLKNAAALSVAYFPRTLGMVLFSVGLWVVCIHFYQFGVPILLLFGFSLPCYVSVLLLNGVFRKLDGDGRAREEDDTSYAE